ncbi:MAG: acyl-ACP--UDP-N-acetylglucosamine O-acyltransferase [Verrucomicrobiales bacterium]|nr:acyl-ACP--UDP-N-acetylglucosamine O-acyltransferase [Verrucomicrobiales bacterium]
MTRACSIHPLAIIHPGASLGAGCEIGPFCVIGEHVVLGDGCKLHSHVVIDGHTQLGARNEIFPFASIGLKTQDLKWKGGITRTVIGDDNTFREYVTIHSATSDGEVTSVGSGNHILAYCHIAHNVTLGDRNIMSNVATLAGHVVVEDHAVIGGLAAVHQFCRIGRMSIIGGCSKVVQDVPPFMMADGNPAETRTINKVGLERNGVGVEAQSALKNAYKILFREGLTISNALTRIEAELPALPEVLHLLDFVRKSERGISK